MGVSVWFFLRPKPGELRPLALRAVEAFTSSGGRLPVDADGFVRYVEVVVRLVDRRAQEVVRVGFFQHRALRDGTIDEGHNLEVQAIVPAAALSLPGPELPSGVIDATRTFAQRRVENLSWWRPTAVDHAALRALVNRKAGRQLIGPNG